MILRTFPLLLAVALLTLPGAQEKTEKPKPEIKGLSTIGVFQGETTTITLYGDNLTPESLTWDKGPLTAKLIGPVQVSLEAEKKLGPQSLKFEVIVPKDCPPDVYRLTLVHASGEKPSARLAVWEPAASELVVKAAPNTFLKALPLVGDSVGVRGTLVQGDTADLFSFEAKLGEEYKITLQAGRAGSEMDALLRIRDARHIPLLVSGGQPDTDREVQFRPLSAGTYFVEVSDADGRGGDKFAYRLSLKRALTAPNGVR